MTKPERRSVQEQVGRSMNASVLRTTGRSPDVETPLMQVAGFGAARLHVALGVDRSNVPLQEAAARPADPRDQVAAELISLLWHIKYGDQRGQLAGAIRLFAQWMGMKARFSTYADRDVLLPRLAARALHEWLSDRCPRCGGTGRLEVTKEGNLIRGSGSMARNARFTQCGGRMGCGGTGRPVPSQTARRLALQLDIKRYDAERWDTHFQAAMTWLSMHLAARATKPLTAQLERSKKRI